MEETPNRYLDDTGKLIDLIEAVLLDLDSLWYKSITWANKFDIEISDKEDFKNSIGRIITIEDELRDLLKVLKGNE